MVDKGGNPGGCLKPEEVRAVVVGRQAYRRIDGVSVSPICFIVIDDKVSPGVLILVDALLGGYFVVGSGAKISRQLILADSWLRKIQVVAHDKCFVAKVCLA
jgi:hypothetical protein